MTDQISGDPTSPQWRVARQFMTHKGLPDAAPLDVEQLENQPVWYFFYELPEGDLELEVAWEKDEWVTTVTAFTLAGWSTEPNNR